MHSGRAITTTPSRRRHAVVGIAALLGLAGIAGPTMADELNAEGWTVLRPSPDTRFVFVSSSEGDDRNSGRSPAKAVRSFARAKDLMRDNSADWMLLKEGDVWETGLGTWRFSGRSEDERVVIASYGDGNARPKLSLTNQTGISGAYGQDISHVAIVGIHFEANRQPGDSNRGIKWQSVGEGLLVEDCAIDGFFNNVSIEGLNQGFENAKFRRNIITDAWSVSGHAQGFYAGDVTGLLMEENVIDHNGWNPDIDGAVATTFKQNVYIQTSVKDVVFRGNISSRSAAAGVQMRAGGIAEDNLFYANPKSLRFGYRTLDWPEEYATGAIRNNVVVGGPIAMEVPEIFGIWTERLRDVVIEGNVIANATGEIYPIAFTMGAFAENVEMFNNTTYDWVNGSRGVAFKFTAVTDGLPAGTVTIRDNRWVMPGSDRVASVRELGMIAFWNNKFEGVSATGSTFSIEGQNGDMADWVGTPNVSDDEIINVGFMDSGRDLGSYAEHIGLADETAFIEAARAMSRDNWNPVLTGSVAAEWIRAGYAPAD
ncbi:MAG: right-handed parallel beta-helix repeat-containing protein [Phycisphaerales bacterium]